MPDARIADDSDAQHAALERERVVGVHSPYSPAYRYWRAIPVAERERIVAAIPEGHRLHVRPGYQAKPGTASVGLRTLDNREAGTPMRGYLTASLCWAALPRVVVTVGADGFVQSIEEVA